MKPITYKTKTLRCKKSLGLAKIDSIHYIKDNYYNIIPSMDDIVIKVISEEGIEVNFSLSNLSSYSTLNLSHYFYTIEEDRVLKIDSLLS